MPQQAKTPASKFEFDPWDTRGGKQEPAPASCSLTSTRTLSRTHIHTLSLNKCKFFYVYWSFPCMYVSAPISSSLFGARRYSVGY